MKRFAQLFYAIDQSTKTTVKVAALTDYFRDADPVDKLWTVALFSGRRPKRAVTTTKLREWAAEVAGVPLWLFEESYAIVGDLEAGRVQVPQRVAHSVRAPGDAMVHQRHRLPSLVDGAGQRPRDGPFAAVAQLLQRLDDVGDHIAGPLQ